MDRWKSTARKKLRHGESQKGEGKRWRRSDREKVRREKMQVREKKRKARTPVFFQCLVAPESKSRLAKAADAKPFGQMKDEKLHAVVARNTFGSKHVQNTCWSRTTFGS